ncbi:MAG TPA: SWIM zinc finger family protein [Acidobacteriaceae bacterium]
MKFLKLPDSEGFMGWGYYPPYVPVAERRANALREVLKLTRKGTRVSPVKIDGRTIASTFWGKAWCDNLESYSDFSNRLPRGRTYVRNGSVVDLQIEPGKVTSLVSGSSLHRITIQIQPLAAPCWKKVKTQCGSQIGSLVELLQGRLSTSVMEIVTQRENGLFPAPREIEMSCSCPDWADMCKHIAATLYGVGSRLDHEPELFFKLRQVDHLELIAQAGHPEARPKSTGRKRIATDQLADVFGIELEAQGKTTHPVRAAKPVRLRKSTSPEEKSATWTSTVKPKGKKSSVSGSKTDSRIKPVSTATRKLLAEALKHRLKARRQTSQSTDKAVPSPPVPAKKTAKTGSAKSTRTRPSR